MSDIETIVATLETAMAAIDQAERAGMHAASGFEESSRHLGQAVSGTSDAEVAALPGLLNQAREATEQESGRLHAAKAKISAYLTKLGGSSGPAEHGATEPSLRADARRREPDAETAAQSKPDPVSQDRVDELRRSLPPPVQPSERQKTHGEWVAGTGGDEVGGRIVSGRDDMEAAAVQFFKDQGARRMPSTVADVEVKLAVHMQNQGITSATVAVNNEVCKGPYGCDTLLPKILPQGSALTVYGTTPDGKPTGATYLGQRRKR